MVWQTRRFKDPDIDRLVDILKHDGRIAEVRAPAHPDQDSGHDTLAPDPFNAVQLVMIDAAGCKRAICRETVFRTQRHSGWRARLESERM